jgi:hypothetical protein
VIAGDAARQSRRCVFAWVKQAVAAIAASSPQVILRSSFFLGASMR